MRQIITIGVRAIVSVFHLAGCKQCHSDTRPMPFSTSEERDDWSVQHILATAHTVVSQTEIRIETEA